MADPTTIENRAAASAAAINHPPINHCHLAPRQPHAGPHGAPARSPTGMLGNEGWQRGASRRPVTSHVGKKGMACHVRVRKLVYVESVEPRGAASAFIRRKGGMSSRRRGGGNGGGGAGRSWQGVHDGGEFGIIVDMLDDQSLKRRKNTFLSPVNQREGLELCRLFV